MSEVNLLKTDVVYTINLPKIIKKYKYESISDIVKEDIYSKLITLNVESKETRKTHVEEIHKTLYKKRIKVNMISVLNVEESYTKAKIEIEKVEVGEKNSLDFQIVVYVSERAFRGGYDDIYIVSNDCGYKQAINYLNSKFNKLINIINYNKVSENIEVVSEISVSKTNENIERVIKKLIPEIQKENITKIINVKNESLSLNDFHNLMRKTFGDELGKEMYSKLKSNIKGLF